MEHTIKPCPFCGGKAKLFRDEEGISFEKLELETMPVFYVTCDKCPALTSGFSIVEAVTYWNMRVKK